MVLRTKLLSSSIRFKWGVAGEFSCFWQLLHQNSFHMDLFYQNQLLALHFWVFAIMNWPLPTVIWAKNAPPLFRSKKTVLFLVPMCLKYCHGNHKPPKTGLLHDLIQFGLSFLCYSGRFCIENWPNFHLNKKNCSSIWFIQTEFLMYGWCLTENPIFPLAPLEYGAYHSNEISLCTNLGCRLLI